MNLLSTFILDNKSTSQTQPQIAQKAKPTNERPFKTPAQAEDRYIIELPNANDRNNPAPQEALKIEPKPRTSNLDAIQAAREDIKKHTVRLQILANSPDFWCQAYFKKDNNGNPFLETVTHAVRNAIPKNEQARSGKTIAPIKNLKGEILIKAGTHYILTSRDSIIIGDPNSEIFQERLKEIKELKKALDQFKQQDRDQTSLRGYWYSSGNMDFDQKKEVQGRFFHYQNKRTEGVGGSPTFPFLGDPINPVDLAGLAAKDQRRFTNFSHQGDSGSVFVLDLNGKPVRALMSELRGVTHFGPTPTWVKDVPSLSGEERNRLFGVVVPGYW